MKISIESLNKYFIYIIFLFIGLNIKIFSGFYFYNLMIILFLMLHFNALKINKNTFLNIIFISIIILISIIVQISYIGNLSIKSFYILLNLIILITFILFIKRINFNDINYNICLLFLSLPIILSILMFHSANVENFFLSFYGIDKYQAFGRYGGVYGRDVNALGIAASMLLLLSMILSSKKAINFILAIVIIILSLYAIILSGMRTGILVVFTALFLFHYRIKILNIKYIIFSLLFLFVFVLSIYNLNDNIKELADYILSRFSISNLLHGFSANSDNGNLKVAIDYFFKTLKNQIFNTQTIFFGINSNLNYVDDFYIFSFIKYGLLFVGSSIVLMFMILRKAAFQNDYIFLLLILISLTLAIKGLFIINNYYMFISIFILYFWRKYENTSRC